MSRNTSVPTKPYSELEAALLRGDARLVMDVMHHRQIVWNEVRYYCGYDSGLTYAGEVRGWTCWYAEPLMEYP